MSKETNLQGIIWLILLSAVIIVLFPLALKSSVVSPIKFLIVVFVVLLLASPYLIYYFVRFFLSLNQAYQETSVKKHKNNQGDQKNKL